MDWLARSAWARRSAHFGVLAQSGLDVEMEYFPSLPDRAWHIWRTLKPQTNILQAGTIDADGDGFIELRR